MRTAQDNTYSTLVGGFDVELTFDEEDETLMNIDVYEAGASVYSIVLDIEPFINDKGDNYTEDLIEDAARAAVDLFESERGTLGQGAEVLREGSMRKNSYFESLQWEDWFMSFKGTSLQEQATTLLESYLNTYSPTEESNLFVQISQTQQECENLRYRMDMLLFEKMKSDTGRQTVIIINAKKACGIDALETWLNKFSGHKLEPQALALAKEYLDTEARLDTLYEQQKSPWEERDKIQFAMEELKIQLLQQNIDLNAPEEGPELAPKMMNDMFELAEGVSFDEPLEPMSDLPASLYEEPTTPGISPLSARRHAETEETVEYEPVEVQQLGELHGGLDIAEIPKSERPFEAGDEVTVSKSYDLPLWGGGVREIPKGTSGQIDNTFDGDGDFVIVRFEDGKLVKFPVDHLN